MASHCLRLIHDILGLGRETLNNFNLEVQLKIEIPRFSSESTIKE